MADHTLFFEELLRTPNLRAKTYVVQEIPGRGLSCIELSARRLEDWFFARRWVSTRTGRRLLFWLLDEVEAQGFRFQVSRSAGSEAPLGTAEGEDWARASEQWASLNPEERRIHTELFPTEARLLNAGYDWDDRGVYRNGVALAADPTGRILEARDDTVHEWVRVPEEFTWRRYPLYALPHPAPGAAAEGAAPIPGT